MKDILANIPHVGGLSGAQAQNQEKKFIWAFAGAEEIRTDLWTDSTDVAHLDALKAAVYFMELPFPDRGGGDHANEKHLHMSKSLLQLLMLSPVGSELSTENMHMDYCEFACIPSGHGIRGSDWRGDIITFINPSDSTLVIDGGVEGMFDCGPWSMFSVEEEAATSMQVNPVNEARLYIVVGHSRSTSVPPPSNAKSALFKPKEAAANSAKKVEPGKTPRTKRGEIATLHVDSGDASNKLANRDAQVNGAAIRWLKDHFAGAQAKQDAYLGVKGVVPEVNVHTKLSKSVMLLRNEYELGFAYRDAGKMETAAFRKLLLAIVVGHPGSAMNWAHTKNLQRGMLKHIIHVDGWEPQPALHGKDEVISATEHAARRKKIINITDPNLVEALRAYVAAMRALIPAELLAKVDNPDKTYDLTVNFSTLPQPQHHDDHEHDGCSGLIVNHYLHKAAVVIFADNLDHDKLWHHWMAENHVYMFCHFLRMQCSHGVYPQFALNDKGSIPKQPSVNKDTLDVCKMTTTLRIGDCTQEDVDAHGAMLAVLMADDEDDKADDDDDDKDFKTPPATTRRSKRSKDKVAKVEAAVDGESEEEEAASVPGGWSTSGTLSSYRDGQWVRHESVWRDSVPALVLQSGATFSLGSDFTKCAVLVLAIGVFHQTSQNSTVVKKRVTALCSFKKDGGAWDPPQFHSAAAIIECAVAVGLEFASVKGAKPFSAEKVVELCDEHSGRDIKNSAGFWAELQNAPTSPKTSPKSSKRPRSGPEELDTQKPPKNVKQPKVP
jgi:hypothetical protein